MTFKMICSIFWYLFILVNCFGTYESLSDITYKPCDNVVLYTNVNGSTLATIDIRTKSKYKYVKLNVTFDVSGTSDEDTDVGDVHFLEEKKIDVSGRPEILLRYQVIFPKSDEQPIITSVIFNGKSICTNSGFLGDHKTLSILGSFRNFGKICQPYGKVRQKRDDYSNNPFLSGSYKPSSDFSSNPFLSNINQPNKVSYGGFGNNPWLQNVGGGDIFGSVPAPTPTPEPPKPTEAPVESFPCGVSKITNNQLVIRGESTRKGEWPWIVGIFRLRLGSLTFQCGGTLISSSIVVTAGHCVVDSNSNALPPQNITVVIGLFDIQAWQTDDSRAKIITEVILHPSFELSTILKHDIALLRFEYPLSVFNNLYLPACLWSEELRENIVFGNFGTIVGWGRDENGLFTTPTPRLTRQKVVTLEECQDSNPSLVPLTSSRTICAGNRNGSGPCNGDSGSGMFFYVHERRSWYLRAIVSTSITLPEAPFACNLNDYVIYTDVSKYLSWIRYYMMDP